jgi:hypothetical protein
MEADVAAGVLDGEGVQIADVIEESEGECSDKTNRVALLTRVNRGRFAASGPPL